MQDYKSLCAAVTITGILVNIQTHRHTQTAFDQFIWQESLQSPTAQHGACKMCASVLLGVGAFRPKFYGNGVIPCQNVDAVSTDRATTLLLETLDDETLQLTFDAFLSKFMKITPNLGI